MHNKGKCCLHKVTERQQGQPVYVLLFLFHSAGLWRVEWEKEITKKLSFSLSFYQPRMIVNLALQ